MKRKCPTFGCNGIVKSMNSARDGSGNRAMLVALSVLAGTIALGCSSTTHPALCSNPTPVGAPATQATLAGLSEHPVVGLLGLPLGTVTDIHASVIAGSELGRKAYEGSYLLRVTDVAGHPLRTPVNLEFNVPGFSNVKLPSNTFELYQMKTGTRADELDSKEIADLQRGYVGTTRHLLVYETGGYSGIPSNLPPDAPVWQDHAFMFSTSLVVLAERG